MFFKNSVSSKVTRVDMAAELRACCWITCTSSALPGEGDAPTGATEISKLRVLRTLKPLRIFKLMRLLRAGQLSMLVDAADALLHLPVFVMRMIRVFMSIAFVVHTCCCMFWLVREATMTTEDIDEVLAYHGLRPNNVEDLLEKYLLSWYFVNTIFTTVGFGDISAETTLERVFVVVVEYIGVVVFGTLLSEVQNVIEDLYHMSRSRARLVLEVRQFLRDRSVPKPLTTQILTWLDFDYEARQKKAQENQILENVPVMLRRSLHSYLHQDLLLRVPTFLAGLTSSQLHAFLSAFLVHLTLPPSEMSMCHAVRSYYRYDLMIDLFAKLTPNTFPKGMPIASRQSANNKLWVVSEGTLIVASYTGEPLTCLRQRDFFGELGLIGVESRYRLANGLPVEYFSNSMVICLQLAKKDFEEILLTFPDEIMEEIGILKQSWIELRQQQSAQRAAMSDRELICNTKWICLILKMTAILIDHEMKGSAQTGEFLQHLCQKLKFNLKGGWGLHWYGGDDDTYKITHVRNDNLPFDSTMNLSEEGDAQSSQQGDSCETVEHLSSGPHETQKKATVEDSGPKQGKQIHRKGARDKKSKRLSAVRSRGCEHLSSFDEFGGTSFRENFTANVAPHRAGMSLATVRDSEIKEEEDSDLLCKIQDMILCAQSRLEDKIDHRMSRLENSLAELLENYAGRSGERNSEVGTRGCRANSTSLERDHTEVGVCDIPATIPNLGLPPRKPAHALGTPIETSVNQSRIAAAPEGLKLSNGSRGGTEAFKRSDLEALDAHSVAAPSPAFSNAGSVGFDGYLDGEWPVKATPGQPDALSDKASKLRAFITSSIRDVQVRRKRDPIDQSSRPGTTKFVAPRASLSEQGLAESPRIDMKLHSKSQPPDGELTSDSPWL